MLFKRLFFQLHLLLGLTSGAVVFIVSTTGAIYAFEEEWRALLYHDVLSVKEEGIRKPISELLKNAKAEFPKPGVKNIRIQTNPERSIEVILKNKQSVLINPYSGKVLGSFDKENDFFGIVLQLHRSLCLGDTGKIITGTSATIFIFMLISGIVLWWPKNKALLTQKLTIKRNAPSKKRTYDLHSVLGFYASWILIFTALTGIVWSFKWAENTMYWLNHSKKEERKYHSEYIADSKRISIDQLLENALPLYKRSSECFINFPEDSIGVYRITFRYDDGGFYKKTDQLFYDQYSGKLLKARLFETASQGDKLKGTNYAIHTGKVFGLTGQLMVFFAALISASLPITGFLMWKSKRKKKKIKL